MKVLADELCVCFIDYGNVETVSKSKTAMADVDLFNIPPQAERFVVCGPRPANQISWSHSEFQKLNNYFVGKTFQVIVLASGTIGFPATIQVENNELCPATELATSSVAAWPDMPPVRHFEAGKCYTVFVTHIESVLDFWIQEAFVQDDLDCFHESIFDCIVHSGRVQNIDKNALRVGMLCIARYHSSDQFLSAVIQSVNGRQRTCVVTFVDYRDSATVMPAELWPIGVEFLSLPVQVTRCCVMNYNAPMSCAGFRANTAGPICVLVRSTTLLFHLVEVISELPSDPGTSFDVITPNIEVVRVAAAAAVPRYGIPPSLSESIWHDIIISHVEEDGTFFCQLLDMAPELNSLMLELAASRPTSIKSALFMEWHMHCAIGYGPVHLPGSGTYICSFLPYQWVYGRVITAGWAGSQVPGSDYAKRYRIAFCDTKWGACDPILDLHRSPLRYKLHKNSV